MDSLRQTRRYVSRGPMTEARDQKVIPQSDTIRFLTSGFRWTCRRSM